MERTIVICFVTSLPFPCSYILELEQKREEEPNISIYNSPWQVAIHSHLVVTAALSLFFSTFYCPEAHMHQSHAFGGFSEYY